MKVLPPLDVQLKFKFFLKKKVNLKMSQKCSVSSCTSSAVDHLEH